MGFGGGGFAWLLVTLAFGAVAGWLAGLLAGGGGGLARNIVVGLLGAMVGHAIFRFFGFGFGGPLLHSLVSAVVGGVVVILIARFVSR